MYLFGILSDQQKMGYGWLQNLEKKKKKKNQLSLRRMKHYIEKKASKALP